MKEFVVKSFSKKGEAVVNMNFAAIDDAVSGLVEVKYPESWKDATTGAEVKPVTDDPYYKAFVEPMLAQKATAFPFPKSKPTATFPPQPLVLKNAALQSTSPLGSAKTASSATSARSFARMRQSAPCFNPRKFLKTLPKPSLRRTRRALRASNTECRFPPLTVPVAEAARTFAPQR